VALRITCIKNVKFKNQNKDRLSVCRILLLQRKLNWAARGLDMLDLSHVLSRMASAANEVRFSSTYFSMKRTVHVGGRRPEMISTEALPIKPKSLNCKCLRLTWRFASRPAVQFVGLLPLISGDGETVRDVLDVIHLSSDRNRSCALIS